jgi:hypothetical protein
MNSVSKLKFKICSKKALPCLPLIVWQNCFHHGMMVWHDRAWLLLLLLLSLTDERRSHGALCAGTSNNMSEGIAKVLHGGGVIKERTRIQCIVKSTFSETKLVPALNDMLIANPSPAAVSRFRMGWMEPIDITNNAPLQDGSVNRGLGLSSFEERSTLQYSHYGTVTMVQSHVLVDVCMMLEIV